MEEKTRLIVLIVLSTLPEALKLAPLIRKLYQYDEIRTIVGVISESNQMLYPLLDQFQIRPDYNFNIMSTGQSLLSVTQRAKDEVSNIIESENPDIVLVHGDSAITFASSQAAFYNKTTIGQVGAGIRTYSKNSPFPEDMYRQLTAALADLHFAPTAAAANHLLMENKKESSITITGDTVFDAQNPFGDGDASRRICEAILYHFGLRKDRPLPFVYRSTL